MWQWSQAKKVREFFDSPRRDANHNLAMQIIKLQEEMGEVSQAFIGATGQNKRKGITHSNEDIANELVDVIITAQVALAGIPNHQALANYRALYVWQRFLHHAYRDKEEK